MGETTAIGWTHHTFNPWRGCSHAVFPPGHPEAGKPHPGCLHCYAEFLVTQKFKMGGVKGEWGPGAPRTVAADSGWMEPLKWARAAAAAGERRRVFYSLGDPLDEEAPKEAQQRFWQLIRETHFGTALGPVVHRPDMPLAEKLLGYGGLDWLLLTKRPWRWELIPEDVRSLVWLGTSISDQATADVWVPELLRADGFRLRFVSAEPLLGPVDLSRYMWPVCAKWPAGFNSPEEAMAAGATVTLHRQSLVSAHARFLDWVIAGGESGADRRPSEVGWQQSLADQCAAAGVPFYEKQDTAFRAGQQGRIPAELWARKEVPFAG